MLQHELDAPPGLWKADIDSAFRRIPIAACMLWAATIAFVVDGQTWVSTHYAMPFGAKASVYAWERLGHFIATVARRLLMLPVMRYVDDFFAAEPLDSLAHAADCFTRLVRAMLGTDAIQDTKRDHGPSLTILGIEIMLSAPGFMLKVATKKVPFVFCVSCFVFLSFLPRFARPFPPLVRRRKSALPRLQML